MPAFFPSSSCVQPWRPPPHRPASSRSTRITTPRTRSNPVFSSIAEPPEVSLVRYWMIEVASTGGRISPPRPRHYRGAEKPPGRVMAIRRSALPKGAVPWSVSPSRREPPPSASPPSSPCRGRPRRRLPVSPPHRWPPPRRACISSGAGGPASGASSRPPPWTQGATPILTAVARARQDRPLPATMQGATPIRAAAVRAGRARPFPPSMQGAASNLTAVARAEGSHRPRLPGRSLALAAVMPPPRTADPGCAGPDKDRQPAAGRARG